MMRIIFSLAAAIAASGCMAGLPSAAAAQGGQRDPAQLLERSDLNGDGRVGRSEYAEARARMFDRLDRNRDGEVNKSDAPTGRFARRAGGGERLKAFAEMMDSNGDGRVTRTEFVDGPAPLFDRADSNRDGFVSRDEIAALRAGAR